MRVTARRATRITLVAAIALSIGALLLAGDEPAAQPERPARVLVFSKTAGFRHDSIPAGIAAIRQLGRAHGFTVTATEDSSAFRRTRLRSFDAVVFLNTTGDVLDPAQQAAFRSYIRHGGGFAGVHSATNTEYDWPFYDGLIGVHFASHPAIQPATIEVTDRNHPSTRSLPHRWTRADEWYNFAADPRELVAAGLNMIGPEAGCRHLDDVPAYLNNLFRLGLIWFSRESLQDPQRYQVLGAQPDVDAALKATGHTRTVRRSIHLTPFGRDFCELCLPAESLPAEPGEPDPGENGDAAG